MNKKNSLKVEIINIIDILSILWKRKKFVFKIILIFTILGFFYSISLKNNFTASSVFYPHIQSDELTNNQGLRSLAGLAGINLTGQESKNIPPSLYPKIINSPEFKIEILNSIINLQGNELSYREYLLTKSSGFNILEILNSPLSILKKLIPKKVSDFTNEDIGILKLTDEEYALHESLSNIILLELNDKEGFIQLNVKDNNPFIASQIAEIANSNLQKKIIDFKLKNLNDTYKFISSQLNIAKNNFYKLQDSLAVFSDKNKNIKSDLFLNQYSRIESEYLISKNIYNELALNKEKTAIEVKKNTPIFTIIKPVVIPNKKSDPKRGIIIIAFSFLGLISAIIYILFKKSIFEVWLKIIKK